MPRPIFDSEDSRVAPAIPEHTYDKIKLTSLKLVNNNILAILSRCDSSGVLDPEGDDVLVGFKDWDSELDRASNMKDAWDTMLQGLGALYRERRLVEKIAERSSLGLGTAALEARLASVRALLGIT